MLKYNVLNIKECISVWNFILLSYEYKMKSDELARTTGATIMNDGCRYNEQPLAPERPNVETWTFNGVGCSVASEQPTPL